MVDIKILRAYADNYMYLLCDSKAKLCAVVDPWDYSQVLQHVKESGMQLQAILTTHHHQDHAGGNEELAKATSAAVYGGDKRIPALTSLVEDKQQLKIGNMNIMCLKTPCHTTGHICYLLTSEGIDPAVFTGDTLFVSGCGKFFEGTAADMYNSLINVLSKLDPFTRVYCGHEYTINNLKFALTVEPENEHMKGKQQWAERRIAAKGFTVPSTINEELLCNPFMRVHSPAIQKYCNSNDPVECMGILRRNKDKFRG